MFFLRRGSVGEARREFFGLGDHLFDFGYGGHSIAEVFGIVDLYELGLEVGGNAMAEFLDCVDSGSFKQFGKLAGNAFDAEQIGVVGPFQD